MHRNRYLRQEKLSFIGESGQARLCRATLLASDSLSEAGQKVAERYALGAGMRVTDASFHTPIQTNTASPRSVTPPRSVTLPPSFVSAFRHAAAANVGLGAGVALLSALSALEIDV